MIIKDDEEERIRRAYAVVRRGARLRVVSARETMRVSQRRADAAARAVERARVALARLRTP